MISSKDKAFKKWKKNIKFKVHCLCKDKPCDCERKIFEGTVGKYIDVAVKGEKIKVSEEIFNKLLVIAIPTNNQYLISQHWFKRLRKKYLKEIKE